MIKVKACQRCKGLFETEKVTEVCPLCEVALERHFKRVRDYVRANKNAGINQVSEACKIPMKQLIRWIREERLFFAEGAQVALPCLNCGDLITFGQYCSPCKHKMMVKLKSICVVPKVSRMAVNEMNDSVLLGNNNRLRRIT